MRKKKVPFVPRGQHYFYTKTSHRYYKKRKLKILSFMKTDAKIPKQKLYKSIQHIKKTKWNLSQWYRSV